MIAFLAACARPAPDPAAPQTTPPPASDTAVAPPIDSGTTPLPGDSAEPVDTGPPLPPVDCAAIPPAPLTYEAAYTEITGARGTYDLVFDDAGNLYGDNYTVGVVQGDYTSGVEVPFAPGIHVEGMDRLPDGDLIVKSSDRAALLRLDANTGADSVFASDEAGYGLVVAPDGTVWTADYEAGIHRFSADGTTKTTIFVGGWVSPRVLDFSPALERLYFGTLGASDGAIYAIDLDADLDPLGDPYVYALGVGNGDYHDSLSTDACGNLYVANYWDHALYRVVPAGDPDGDGHPNGTAEVLYDYASDSYYGHGATFGSGVGGWRSDAIYAPFPHSPWSPMVAELIVGVPSRTWPGPVLPAPVRPGRPARP
jgi:hypothetical protein